MDITKQVIEPRTIMTPDEAAVYLSLDKRHVMRLFNAGKIKGNKIGHRTIRFHIKDLDAFIRNADMPLTL